MTGTSDNTIEKPSILLVEDDRLTRTVLRHDLKLCGFDGTQYLRLAPSQRLCQCEHASMA